VSIFLLPNHQAYDAQGMPLYPPFNAYPGHVPLPEQGRGMAVAGLVIGIISLVMAFIPIFGIIPPILGIIFSAAGMRSVSSRGQAVAGLICSLIALVLSIIMIAAYTS